MLLSSNIYKSLLTLGIMKAEKRVIVSTIYSGKAVKLAIKALSPDKMIFVMDQGKEKTRDNALNELKKVFGGIIEIELLKVKDLYDIAKIAEKVTEKIDKEKESGNEIILHISEGRKTTSLALLFAGYSRKAKVSGAYYITEETGKVITLPMIDLKPRESKKDIIREIDNKITNIEQIAKRVKIKPSTVYQHIQELKDEGYLEKTKELKVTDLGRMVVM